MNLDELHNQEKQVSVKPLFQGELGTAMAMQLPRNGSLKEHITKTEAMLLCFDGVVHYEDENKLERVLERGDYVVIPANVKHWLYSPVQSQLVLLK